MYSHRRHFFGFLPIMFVTAVGCSYSASWNNDSYVSAVKSGRLKIQAALDMESVFPNTEHFLIEYGNNRKDSMTEWQTVSFFEGRYELTMVSKVQLSADGRRVTQVSDKMKFHLGVVRSCIPDGGCSYDTSRSWNFGLPVWQEFIKSQKDYKILDPQYDGSTVEYFDALAESAQAPRRIWRSGK